MGGWGAFRATHVPWPIKGAKKKRGNEKGKGHAPCTRMPPKKPSRHRRVGRSARGGACGGVLLRGGRLLGPAGLWTCCGTTSRRACVGRHPVVSRFFKFDSAAGSKRGRKGSKGRETVRAASKRHSSTLSLHLLTVPFIHGPTIIFRQM